MRTLERVNRIAPSVLKTGTLFCIPVVAHESYKGWVVELCNWLGTAVAGFVLRRADNRKRPWLARTMGEKQCEVDMWIRQTVPCLICKELFAWRLRLEQEIGPRCPPWLANTCPITSLSAVKCVNTPRVLIKRRVSASVTEQFPCDTNSCHKN